MTRLPSGMNWRPMIQARTGRGWSNRCLPVRKSSNVRAGGIGRIRVVLSDSREPTVRRQRKWAANGVPPFDPSALRVPEERLALLRGRDDFAPWRELDLCFVLTPTQRVPPLPHSLTGRRIDQDQSLGDRDRRTWRGRRYRHGDAPGVGRERQANEAQRSRRRRYRAPGSVRLDVRGPTWTTSTLTRFRPTVPNATRLPSGENAAACCETGALSRTAAPRFFQVSRS